MRRAAILIALTAALLALSAPAAPAAASAKACGKVSVGFTNARVWGLNTTCHFARTLVRRWVNKVDRRTCNESNDFCRVTQVRRWRCVLGGDEGIVRLRCTTGRKRVRAAWGD